MSAHGKYLGLKVHSLNINILNWEGIIKLVNYRTEFHILGWKDLSLWLYTLKCIKFKVVYFPLWNIETLEQNIISYRGPYAGFSILGDAFTEDVDLFSYWTPF